MPEKLKAALDALAAKRGHRPATEILGEKRDDPKQVRRWWMENDR